MVALNPDFAPSQTGTEPENRVGGFFSLAAESVGVDRCSSRNRIGEKRGYAYETASVDTEYEYSPFGEVVRSSGSYADVNTCRFSTKYLDTETEFYYYGYRHYDPAIGRWLSKDPLGEAGGLNLYVFVLNQPTRLIDARGEFGLVGAAIGAAVGGVVGGVTAAVNGKSVAAGIAGGAIGGAIAGSGAGLIAGAIGSGAAAITGAAAGTAALGAAGGAVGNATTQVGNGLAQGQSLGQAASNINESQVVTSAALGAVSSLVGGGVGGLSQAARNSTSALQQQMGQSLNGMSQTLRNMGSSQATINSVQNSIVNGIGRAGFNQANVLAAVAALNSTGLPITQAAIENWINQNPGNSSCK